MTDSLPWGPWLSLLAQVPAEPGLGVATLAVELREVGPFCLGSKALPGLRFGDALSGYCP